MQPQDDADERSQKRARLSPTYTPTPARSPQPPIGNGAPSKSGAEFLLRHVLQRAGPRSGQFLSLLRKKAAHGSFESHGRRFCAEDVEEAASLHEAGAPPAPDAPGPGLLAPPDLPGALGSCIRATVDGPVVAAESGALELAVRRSSGEVLVVEMHDQWREELADDPWMLRSGDAVHLIGRFDRSTDRVVLRDNSPDAGSLLIAHPDVLLTGTSIASTVDCRRKALINDEFGDGATNRWCLLGNCVHDVVQACLAARDFSAAAVELHAGEALARSRLALWSMGEEEANFAGELRGHCQRARLWAELHFEPRPVAGQAKGAGARDGKWLISRMCSAELSVHSARFGVRGKVDACVLARRPGVDERPQVLALELKSGKMSTEHFGQIAVYRLLLADLYRENCAAPGALLLYTKSGDFQYQEIDGRLLRGIVRSRNHLASIMRRRGDGDAKHRAASADGGLPAEAPRWPRPLRRESVCHRCFSRQACAVAHKAMEGGDAESFGVPGVFEEVGAAALTDVRTSYFARWVNMIDAEASLMASEQSRLWTADPSTSGDKPGARRKTLTQLRLLRAGQQGGEVSAAPRWEFSRSSGIPPGVLEVGDPVLVSRAGGPFAFAAGNVVEISKYKVRIQARVDCTVALTSAPGREAVHRHVADIEDMAGAAAGGGEQAADGHIYRLDMDEYGGGWRQVRGSLTRLLTVPSASRVAELVVDLRPPRPRPGGVAAMPGQARQCLRHLNAGQAAAVAATVRAADFSILAGYPGSGKTETVLALISTLIAMGERVLLCAHTNTAVDNVLLKMRKLATCPRFVRCGNFAQIDPALHDFTVTSRSGTFVAVAGARENHNSRVGNAWQSVSQVAEFAAGRQLFACTTTGAAHESLIASQQFDTIIIEEASQATECSVWAPLLRCKGRFVLVGDVNQLQPLVRNPRARDEGMGQSLMERLGSAHAAAVAELTEQYRMCGPVADVVNSLFYAGRLRSSAQIAGARLLLPGPLASHPAWVASALKPERSVALIDTDAAGAAAREARLNDVLENRFEVSLVKALVASLLGAGLPAQEILVISPYRQQLRLLDAAIRELGQQAAGAEVLTVDRAQGRAAGCVLLSTVRSNAEGRVGDLLCDWRRLNVALSRAKHKLVLVGSASTLEGAAGAAGDPCAQGESRGAGHRKLQQLVAVCRGNNWVVQGPEC